MKKLYKTMYHPIIFFAFLATQAQAQHYDHHDATSSVRFNQHHSTVHHIQSAPALLKAAPLVAAHAAPVFAAPHTSVYARHQTAYQAPAFAARQAAPALATHEAPAFAAYHGPPGQIAAHAVPFHNHAQTYAGLQFGAAHGAPAAAHFATHVAKVAAPVLVKAAPVKAIAAPVLVAGGYHQGHGHHEEQYAPAKYIFEYGVEDTHTGDIHSHKEQREGDLTQGEYSLHEADGTIRTVKYTVDKHSGFNAVVERSGKATHPQPSKILKAAVPQQHYNH
nr:unnamed protein product [Callosobruchus analis]